jgi:hypothetical protein
MASALGLNSYFALGKQSDDNTPVKPSVYVEMDEEDITPGWTNQTYSPSANTREKNYKSIPGKNEAPAGTVTLPVYAKTFGHILNMNYGAPSTSGPTDTSAYTHVFTPTASTAVPAYTADFSSKDLTYVHRVWGIKGSGFTLSHDENLLTSEASMQGLGIFVATQVTTTASSGTALVVSSNKGITTSDTITVSKGDSVNTADYTVAAVNADGVTVTLGAAITGVTHTAGDRVVIKSSTPSYALGSIFTMYGGSEFKIATAIGSVAAYDAEEFSFEFMQELEARHASTGFLESDRNPVANLPKGVAASTAFKWYHQDVKWVNYLRAHQQLAATMQWTGGTLAGAASVYDSMLIRMANLKSSDVTLPKFSGEDNAEDDFSFDCIYDSSAGYASQITLVNATSAY